MQSNAPFNTRFRVQQIRHIALKTTCAAFPASYLHIRGIVDGVRGISETDIDFLAFFDSCEPGLVGDGHYLGYDRALFIRGAETKCCGRNRSVNAPNRPGWTWVRDTHRASFAIDFSESFSSRNDEFRAEQEWVPGVSPKCSTPFLSSRSARWFIVIPTRFRLLPFSRESALPTRSGRGRSRQKWKALARR